MSGLPESDDALIGALLDAQRQGFLGARPIPEVMSHARGFVRALERHEPIASVLDLGSGGGVPGLIIAHDRPTTRVTLLDRRAKRTDFLERVVRRLGWDQRVTVTCADAETFGPPHSFDAVVARGFGPPQVTLTMAARLVRPGGPIVISEPPDENRWDDDLLEHLQLRRVDAPARDGGADEQGLQDRLVGLVAVFVAR